MKKEELIKETGRLRSENENWAREDKRVRAELSKILRYENDAFGTIRNGYNSPEPMTWIQIAFAIGELRADANYSMLIESREEMKREIAELKNPPIKE